MTIRKWVQKELEKYSFVTKVEMKGAKVHIHYLDGDKNKKRIIPYRADKFQLEKVINSIKDEIGYEAAREASIKRGDYDTDDYKPSTFVYSHD